MTLFPQSRRVAILLALTVAAIAAIAVGCGGSHSHEDLTVSNAWARSSAASQDMGAAYMEIMGGKEADTLLSIKVPSDVAAEAQIHEMVMMDGEPTAAETAMEGGSTMEMEGGSTMEMDMGGDTTGGAASGEMQMRQITSLAIPAGEMVMLKPGGYHVMLIQLAKPLEVGEKFDFVLTFEKAGNVTVPVEVKEG